MKILKDVIHYNGKSNISFYDFEFLEKSKIIDIIKDGKAIYEMRNHNGKYYCNCPAKGRCWHLGEIGGIFSQKFISGFEADLAEGAGLLRINTPLTFPKYKRRIER